MRSIDLHRVVRVVIDADDVTLDDAAEVSQDVERLDAAGMRRRPASDPMGEASLHPRGDQRRRSGSRCRAAYFRRAAAGSVVVDTADGPVTGHLLRAGDSDIDLALVATDGPARGTVRVVTVPYDRITGAKVEVEFSAPPAAVQELLARAQGVNR